MSNKNQTTDQEQSAGASGTKVTKLSPKPYTGVAKHSSVNGVSGENSTPGNRNKAQR